jgi:tripartite-type tricarboxylate transporter receptor subunit TctC
MVAEVPYVMVASPKAPVASFAELIAYAWFKSLTNIDVVLVTYRGGANVLSDLLGGQIDLAVETCSILLPQLRDGKLRPLGTPSPKRLDVLPDVPSMAENGVPGFVASSWTGIVAPPGTSKQIIDKLNRAHQCRPQRSGHASQAETAGSSSHVWHAGRLCRFP